MDKRIRQGRHDKRPKLGVDRRKERQCEKETRREFNRLSFRKSSSSQPCVGAQVPEWTALRLASATGVFEVLRAVCAPSVSSLCDALQRASDQGPRRTRGLAGWVCEHARPNVALLQRRSQSPPGHDGGASHWEWDARSQRWQSLEACCRSRVGTKICATTAIFGSQICPARPNGTC